MSETIMICYSHKSSPVDLFIVYWSKLPLQKGQSARDNLEM